MAMRKWSTGRGANTWLLAAAFIVLAASAPVMAQEQGADEAGLLEEVVVTGSRIAGQSDTTSTTPVSVFSAEDIEVAGTVSLEGFIQAQPFITGGFYSSRVNNGNSGYASVSMRGLGSNRTLVLVDGHRMPPVNDSGFVDINMIPVGAVERIEVLRDGASTVYGSDAIAGVINVITKQDFDGTEIQMQADVTGEGDGEIYRLSMVTGGRSDRGSVTFGAEYTERRPIWQGDRAFSACPLGESGGEIRCIGSGTAYPANVQTSQGSMVVDPETGEIRPFGNDDTYNYAAVSYMVTPNKVFSYFGNGRYDLLEDGGFSTVSAFVSALGANRTSQQQLAPVGTFWAPTVPASHPDNPFGEDVTVTRRLGELENGRFYTQDAFSWRIIAGLEGEFQNGWNWSVSYNYGRFFDGQVVNGQINQPRVETVLDPARCAADPECPKLWDPFRRDTLDEELQGYILVTHSPVGRRTNRVAQATLAGDLGDLALPAGPIQWVLGAEQRKEDAQFIPDGAAFLGQIYFVSGDRTEGELSVDEYYGEMRLPILEGAPMADLVALNASLRRSDYGGSIGSDTNLKGSIEWAPWESLRLRATYAEGFRFPTISELYSPQELSAQQYNDPCLNYGANPNATLRANCEADGLPPDFSLTSNQATSLFGGNPDLQPEQSESTSWGVVWTPEFAPTLSVRLDYFDIEITDAIGTAGTNNVIQSCYNSPGFSNPLCGLIEGPAAVGESAHPVSPRRNSLENLAGIILTNANLSTFQTSGIDFGLSYGLELRGGRLDLGVEGTWLENYDYLPFVGADLVQGKGKIAEDQYTGNPAAFAEWQARFNIGYVRDNWGVSWLPRYMSSVDDIFASPANLVNSAPSIWYHDVQGRVSWDHWDFTLGVRNLTDETPPYITNYDDMNTIQFSYDTAGRYYYFRVGLAF